MAMDDVSKISFSALNNTQFQKQKHEEKEVKKEEEAQVKQASVEQKSPESVLNAMDITGAQNKTFLGLTMIDPKKYLTPERIKDIETSMGVFDDGVQNNLKAINEEFKNLPEFQALKESDKLEMAAKMMILT